MLPNLKSVLQLLVLLVADAFITVKLNIVDAAVVGGQRRDQFVLFSPVPFLLKQFFLCKPRRESRTSGYSAHFRPQSVDNRPSVTGFPGRCGG